jgi:two-component sensor histidine kinase
MTLVDLAGANPVSNGFMALAHLDEVAMDALPLAVYLCAGDGRVVRFNQKAAELWGRAPKPGDPDERFCGSFRLYLTDGTLLPHDQCPVATALQTGASFHNHEVVIERPDGQRLTLLVNIAALKDTNGRVNGAINCFQDITDRKQEEDRQHYLIQELNHRIKNTLATVYSMSANTARSATSIVDFKSRFEARLLALSHAHSMLSEGQWRSAKLRDLLAQQLEPFGVREDPRVRLEGPEVDLQPQLALALSMVFHELMTNAAKYGPLSVEGGQISVEWKLSDIEGDRQLTLQWLEMDGPPVQAPQRTGFGTRLIRTITKTWGGNADLLFESSGLQVWMSVPLQN